MTRTFNCPSCGAPLEPEGTSTTIRCRYCSASVIVPPELREPEPASISFTTVRIDGAPTDPAERSNPPVSSRASGWVVGLIIFLIAAATLIPIVFAVILPAMSVASAVKQVNAVETVQGINRTPVGPLRSATPRPETTPVPSPTPGFADLLLSFGGEGIGPGKFQDARSIAVDRQGNIYVAEYTGGRVQSFDPQGKFLTQFLVDAEMPVKALGVDRQGALYISQGGVITRYKAETGETLGSLNPPAGKFYDHFTFSPSGEMAVVVSSAQAPDDIAILDTNGKLIRSIPAAFSTQTNSSELEMSLAFDGLGNLYALGSFNSTVLKFNPQGKFVTRFGSEGDEPGQFGSVESIATDDQGRVYVSNISEIQVFDATGRYINKIDRQKTVYFDVTFGPDGGLWAAGRTQIYKFQPQSRP